jgi:hypothetical protein
VETGQAVPPVRRRLACAAPTRPWRQCSSLLSGNLIKFIEQKIFLKYIFYFLLNYIIILFYYFILYGIK